MDHIGHAVRIREPLASEAGSLWYFDQALYGLPARRTGPARLIDLDPLGRPFDERVSTSWVPSGARGRCCLVMREAPVSGSR
ncbi:MAG: hypothetical protein ACFB6R_02615 [Alphaproteobacteria bacterium]